MVEVVVDGVGDIVVLVIVVGMVGVVIMVGTVAVASDIVVVDTVDDSVSFNAFMVNGTIIPDTTSTIVTINPISKYFFLIFMQGIKPVQLFRKCILSVILGFISISFLLILFTPYFRIEELLINVPPFFLSISCSV